MNKFESEVAKFLSMLGAQVESLASSVRSALPHSPIHSVHLGFPHAALDNMKLSGECAIADTLKMLEANGVTHPNMPKVVNYLVDHKFAWSGRLPFEIHRYIGAAVDMDSLYITQGKEPIILTDPKGEWRFVIKPKNDNTGFYRSQEASTEMVLEFRDQFSEGQLELSALGNPRALKVETNVRHRGDIVTHYNPEVFHEDWMKETVFDPLTAALEKLALERLGETLTVAELGKWVTEHVGLMMENETPAQFTEKSAMSDKRMVNGTYFTASQRLHPTLDSEINHRIVRLDHVDNHCTYSACFSVIDRGEGVFEFATAQVVYQISSGMSSGYRVWKNSLAGPAELVRLKRIYAPVFAGLRMKKEEQEAAPPADTPAE